MAYKACIFDLDGTLADTLRSIAGFGNDTLSAFGLPPIPVEDYKHLVGNGADVLMDRDAAHRGGRSSPRKSGSASARSTTAGTKPSPCGWSPLTPACRNCSVS